MLSSSAKEAGVFVIGGSISERDGDRIYNTSYSFNSKGERIGKYRKAHLFDIDIPGRMTFKESDVLSPGQGFTVLDTEGSLGAKIGMGICYDMRFPELSLVMALQMGCKVLCFPGAFNTVTGPKHWELLIRARAVDCQAFVIAASPARSPDPSAYQAWGHSTICSPWGEVLATTGHDQDIVYADIDLAEVDNIRQMIPVRHQRRSDLYSLKKES
jgi:omega-amidase